jgi:benzodiazapine receptor
MSSIIKLIISITVCYFVAVLGGWATFQSVQTWYLTINKPSFNPPSWLFGPVWSVLYTLMAIAFWLVWKTKDMPSKTFAMQLFLIQLALNLLWSFLFFYFKTPFWAFLEIILMWTTILFTIIYFYKINPWSAYILIPYLLWVGFATILNGSIWILNS